MWSFVSPSFTWYNVFEVPMCCSMYKDFIPSYCLIIFHCMGIPHFIYSFICSWKFELFSLLTINAAIYAHIFVCLFWIYIFISLFRILPRSVIAESYVNSLFHLLRNCQTVFQSGCTILHSHQQYLRVPISPYPCQDLSNFLFFNFLKHL